MTEVLGLLEGTVIVVPCWQVFLNSHFAGFH